MKRNLQRIALAEWAGWEFVEIAGGGLRLHEPNGDFVGSDPDPDTTKESFLSDLPDTDCLDVLHDLEERLDEGQRRTYFYYLFGTQRLEDGDLWKAVHVPAAQRREALLRTLGLFGL